METINYEEFAEKFALGTLSEEERVWFEKELDNNPALQQRVKFYNDLVTALTSEPEVLEFRSILREAGAEYRLGEERKKIRRLVIRASITAAGFLLVVASVFLYLTFGNKHQTPDRIFAENYSPYLSASMTFRSGANQHQDQLTRAIQCYDEGRYRESIQLFDSMLRSNPANTSAMFYNGMAQMGLGEYKKAENYLQQVMDNGNNLFVDQAEWYRSLCLVMLNDRRNALSHLRHLAAGNGYYSPKAAKILKTLDSH